MDEQQLWRPRECGAVAASIKACVDQLLSSVRVVGLSESVLTLLDHVKRVFALVPMYFESVLKLRRTVVCTQ